PGRADLFRAPSARDRGPSSARQLALAGEPAAFEAVRGATALDSHGPLPTNSAVMTSVSRDDLLSAMAENRRAFLSFLERRVGHRETAEDLLQEAFARSLDRVPLEAEESVTAWFYRVLRNGVIDHYRRRGASERTLSSLQKELDEAPPEPTPDERDAVCHCVRRLSETLKPEDRQPLRWG